MASSAAPESPSRTTNFSVDDDVIEEKAGIELDKPVHNDDDDEKAAESRKEAVVVVAEGGDETVKESDSVVEAVRVELAQPGVAVVGEVEEKEEEKKEVVVDESLPLENEFDKISGEAEEPVELVEKDETVGVAKAEESVQLDKKDKHIGDDDDDDGKSSVELDTVVEGVHVNLLEPGVVAVGEVEGSKEESSEVEAMVEEEKVVESFPVDDNKFDKIASDGEDLVRLKTAEKGGGVEESDSVVDAVRVELAEPGLAVVGEVDSKEEAEFLAMLEEKVVDNIPVEDNKFDKIAGDSEDLVKLDVNHTEDGTGNDDAAEIEISSLANEGSEVDGNAADDDAVPKAEPEVSVVKEAEEVKHLEDDDQDERLALTESDVGQVADFDNVSGETAVVPVASNDRSVPVEVLTESDVGQVAESDNVSGETVVAAVASSDRSVPVEALTESDVGQVAESDNVTKPEAEDEDDDEEVEVKTRSYSESESDEETEGKVFGSSEAAKQFLKELKQASAASAGEEDFQDGQIVTDSDEEEEEEGDDTDEEGEEGKELFDSAALAALLKAASGASGTSSEGEHTVTVTSQDGSQRLFSLERPAGLGMGSSFGAMRRAAPPNRSNLFAAPFAREEPSDESLSEEQKKKLENMQQMMIKYLRLVFRLGYSPDESIVSQVLYRMALIAGKKNSQIFNVDAAKRIAHQLETEKGEAEDDVTFSLNILVLGKSGVGKSSTVNGIFGEEKSVIDAFEPATESVKEINAVVDGIKIRIIDSPGLKLSGSEQGRNRRILNSIKSYMKRCPPDIVLYVDRLDTQTRDLNDLPLLKSITAHLGSSIWRNAIVTLTHAASAPPDGPSGAPLSYDVFVAQRSHVLQQSIGQAVGDLRLMNPSLMNPVSLVENHSSCRRNRDGEKVLPNGQSWRLQLLLLCSSMKILSESKPDAAASGFDPRKLFGAGRARAPPLPYMLSWLLQSRPHPKLPADESSIDEDIELADYSDSDQEDEEDEYDQLPPFKPLRKNQLAKLSKEQTKAYLEEYDYRVKLLQKKQLKEELRRMKEIKKKGNSNKNTAMASEDYAEDAEPAAVQVPLPDMVLPPSFDSDNPAYRYRFLEPSSQLLVRPVLDTHGWDHDPGYDGVNVENSFVAGNKFPAALTVQVTKDKKDFNLHLDSSVAVKHGGENNSGSSMAGFDIQNVGRQLAYVVRGETKFKNYKKNRTAAGVSVTFLGQNVATGFKLEDQISLGKRVVLVGSTGTVRSQGDSAYGANLEVRLREADFPIGQDQSSLGLSLVKWRGDLALAANLQSQFSVGRSSKIAVRGALNNKLSGQISVRTSSSDQLNIALVGILPIVMSIYKSIRPAADEGYSAY
ncbi:Translocase of chloroplast 159, chloroplastic [Linum grandiflorum]